VDSGKPGGDTAHPYKKLPSIHLVFSSPVGAATAVTCLYVRASAASGYGADTRFLRLEPST
jgi:hypothetical protein